MTRLLLALTFAYLLAVVLLAGCRPRPASAPAATETAVAPTATVAMPTDTPTTEPATAEPTSTPTATTTATPQATATSRPAATPAGPTTEGAVEAILILEPGPGSRVTSPVRVAGEADPTFEQNLAVRILPLDGSQLALEPATIAAELGERGPFALEIPFSVQEEQQALIQVFASSARDGGVTHLSSVMVTLLPEGDAEVVPATPHPERITITTPEVADTVSGGVVHVEGVALASFEQTLVVELLDAEGDVVASEPVIVDAPDLGEPGPFSIDLPYAVATAGPGRIVVRDPSPALDADVHLSSVEITLEP